MTRSIVDLSQASWRFGQVSRQSFAARPRDDRAAVAQWRPASVPGDVRADLLAAGELRSLDAPEELARSGWVDAVDWWYRAALDAVESGTTAVLEADGIDYLCGIWLDGEWLATHQGMFGRQAIVLPRCMAAAGKHELAARIWGAGALPRLPDPPLRRGLRRLLLGLHVVDEYFPDRMATAKAQYGFGWDFAPRVLSTGIWDEIRLVRCRRAYLADLQAQAEPMTDADPAPVRWTVRLTATRFEGQPLTARVELRALDGQPISLSREVFDLGGADTPILAFDSHPLARWWPWDQGPSPLYCLKVCLFDERGPADEQEIVVGVRTVRRERLASGRPWRFTVNGRPVFLRGANWAPADILPGRLAPGDYSRLIGQARRAGINFLRIWGGGIREKAAFWQQCNNQGIMAMQEFPLACAFLDHYPREDSYLAVLESEAQGIVCGLRNHPSLIAWCGGNEISPRRERVPLRTIEQVLAREDPARPWITASPSQGDVHNWDVWHGSAPWQSLARGRAPFMSEFGVQALPHADSVAEMFPSGAPTRMDDPAWAARKLQVDKLRHYSGPLPEGDLVATIETTQRTQAAALQCGIEACRLRREGSGNSHPCGGVAFWQFNEPWPAVSWSVVDRRGRPKSAYAMLLRSYQPLLVAARFDWRPWQAGDRFDVEIWAVNDAAEGVTGCEVEASLDGRSVYTCAEVTIEPASAQRIGSFSVELAGRPASLALTCRARGASIAANEYDLRVYLPPRQRPMGWLKRRAGDLLLQIG